MRHLFGFLPILLSFQLTTGAPHSPPSASGGGTEPANVRGVAGRLMISPTAAPLGAGELVLSVHEFFFPALALGVTDRFSISGGFSLLPGGGNGMFHFNPGYTTLRWENIDIACGFWYLKKTGGSGTGFGYVNLTCTAGEGSVTFGAGWGLHRAGGSHGPLLMGGTSLRLSGETDMLSEFIIPPNLDPALVAVGTRWGAENVSVEFGVMMPLRIRNPGGGPGKPLPWTSFSIVL
jgi:hypothetical protein